MKVRLSTYFLLFAMAMITFHCSSDDEPIPVNEEEVITTVKLTMVPQGGGGTPVILQSQDLDGDGPNPPVITISGDFAINTVYDGTIELLNETASPAEDITGEVEQEGEEHQFFFQTGGGINISVDYNDQDSNGNPIGLTFTISAGDASTGTLTVILLHLPDKQASGVREGDISNAGGETDISISFSVGIQ